MSDYTPPTAVQLLHPHWRNQAIARAEAEAAANGLDPRAVLREAHAARAEAAAETSRLETALERARQHLAEVAAHYDDLAGAIEAEDAKATKQLLAELTEGVAGRPSPAARHDGERRVALANAESERSVAQRALDQLTADWETARKRLATAVRAVQEAAAALLLEVARREAEQIRADADALDRRRAGLDQLGIEVTNMQRQLGITPGSRPWLPVIGEALHPELRDAPRLPTRFAGAAPEAQRRWSTAAKALLDDAEACLDLDTVTDVAAA
jgi:hypothetical protein